MIGVADVTNGGDGVGVVGIGQGTGSSVPYGVEALGLVGSNNIALYGYTSNPGLPNEYAGYFYGTIYALSATSSVKAFKIDHPLDPENKYLYHSSVESNDMMNIYNGNVTTDANGYATITLPDYFEALNKDFRYQLTCIGTFAQAIVSEKVHNNTFSIRTDKPNVEVSWQVTGVRHDPVAEQYRIVNEVEKPAAEKGKYLVPTVYGQGQLQVAYPPVIPKGAVGAKPAQVIAPLTK
jgi:hypothetical protein